MQNRISINWLTCVFVCAIACGMVADAIGAEGQSAEKTYLVLGSGASATGDESEGRQAAITDALTAAVGQATQNLLGPEALRQHFGELDDILFRQPQQYISNYKVLSQSHIGQQYRVLLEATVTLRKIDQQLKSYGILENKAKIPTLLLLIAEQNIDDLTPRFWWGSNKKGASSSAMETMADPLKAQGLAVLDPAQLQGRKDVDWKRFNKAELTFREAASLGQQAGADLVIVGNSLAIPSSAEVGSDMQALKGSVSAHVINAENAEQVAKISETALGMHKNEVEAGNEALSNAGRIAGQALASENYPGLADPGRKYRPHRGCCRGNPKPNSFCAVPACAE